MIRLLLERSPRHSSDTQKLTAIKSVELEKMNRYRGTPLALAALNGLDEVVKLLLDYGANIEALDKAGRSPLLRAFQSGHASTVKLLVQNGAVYLGQSGEPSALWPSNDQELIVESLVNGGADIESRNEKEITQAARPSGTPS
ncbi:Ankyrin repeat and KH domain-containing protein [Colletotrichum fructicola]|uniref:Ankyrin repeat and KH domain-containing protein n=1 Tax=Colletotrichum fructicola (strain Nara gc5) TaxID=1213859 RepID=A0A7J6IXF3_COLFN|nr:Ankyrin repeat and KH domain-containing protein [Colletotrichum fructicola Nara gc5]KAF4901129.1 Ankyrin repeat and KH domain-containing protein [Colletotrichum fructicola]KAF4911436.1 Ankyrin repeat and KH domain-containing protein [Colletotrichum fructicola]KAF4939209.1 Ankyrin repeat and KH domain-containing protein [Colletotrichum fructicola]